MVTDAHNFAQGKGRHQHQVHETLGTKYQVVTQFHYNVSEISN